MGETKRESEEERERERGREREREEGRNTYTGIFLSHILYRYKMIELNS